MQIHRNLDSTQLASANFGVIHDKALGSGDVGLDGWFLAV
jgi:hypothetical protein